MSNRRDAWTEEEDNRLLELRAAGKRPSLIAKELKRSETAIIARTARLKQRLEQGSTE